MKTVNRILLVTVACLIATAGAWAAATPDVDNTDMTTRTVTGNLKSTLDDIVDRADDAVWIGYAVPMIPGVEMCCGDYNRRHCLCKLERERNTYQNHYGNEDDKDMHVARDMFVLFRAEDRTLERIRTFSENCELDAGGVPMVWLTGVEPTESIALLKGFALSREGSRRHRERVRDHAVSAIAMHDDPSVLGVLEDFVDPDRDADLREKAVFWIGNHGGMRAVRILDDLLQNDRDSDVREKAIFALTLPDEPEATDALIRAARHDRSSDVRSNALFWLANAAGEKAADAIEDAVDNDPDTDVKKQAVFALSQLPDDQGVPKLIHVANTNRNAEVRKQAIFWLGQSGDDRALDFFEDILSR